MILDHGIFQVDDDKIPILWYFKLLASDDQIF